MIKLRYKRFNMRSKYSKVRNDDRGKKGVDGKVSDDVGEIRWELRPGGMLVQKREKGGTGFITIKVSTVTKWHHISIEATSTFGELKMVLSPVTGLEPREQRLVYRGKEREDKEHLHMVGVGDQDKVLLLEDPAIKETKLRGFREGKPSAAKPLGVFDCLPRYQPCKY